MQVISARENPHLSTPFSIKLPFVTEEGQRQTNAVFAASCEASRIDDIIVEIHGTGAELVTIHDRPEGSRLGVYNYIIEVENNSGLTDKLVEKIDAIPEVRCLGSFNVIAK